MSCDQTRFTAAFAKYGLSLSVIQPTNFSLRENAGRSSFSPGFGAGSFAAVLGAGGSSRSGPPRKRGFTGSPFRPGAWSFALPLNSTSPVPFSPMLKARAAPLPLSCTARRTKNPVIP